LQWAEQAGHEKIVELLTKRGGADNPDFDIL
jgi:hypothetical protein